MVQKITTQMLADVGTAANQLVQLDGTGKLPAVSGENLTGIQSGGAFENAFLHIRDEKVSGTHGGTFTSGAFQTRTLNTVKTNQIAGASLSSNQITLPAGTYYVEAFGVAWRVSRNVTRLYDTTGLATLVNGRVHMSTINHDDSGGSGLEGRFTLSVTSAIEFQHRAHSTYNTYGFGEACNWGEPEVFADVLIWKVS